MCPPYFVIVIVQKQLKKNLSVDKKNLWMINNKNFPLFFKTFRFLTELFQALHVTSPACYQPCMLPALHVTSPACNQPCMLPALHVTSPACYQPCM